ncbi:MAG: GntR family transcriptional regulator [Pseudomonadota bacterium]
MNDASFKTVLPRRTLGPAIADRLREEIVNGDLGPGEKLNERVLCERLQVSRTPLREALGLLAAEGLIALSPHRGARVTEVTLAEVEEVFPVLAALERLTGERAAARATEAEIAAIDGLTQRMTESWQAGDRRAYFALNEQIHAGLLEAARNPTLGSHTRMLAGRIRRARFQANLTDARWQAAVSEHQGMVVVLQARDGGRLGAMLADHLGATLASLRHVLTTDPSELGAPGTGDG